MENSVGRGRVQMLKWSSEPMTLRILRRQNMPKECRDEEVEYVNQKAEYVIESLFHLWWLN